MGDDRYQVQLEGLSGGWVAVSPESPHGPCDAVHVGDYWHTTMPDARAHAEKVAAARPELEVQIVRRDAAGQLSVALTYEKEA